MSKRKVLRTPENVERFITMVLLGCDSSDIAKEIGIARSTYYSWFYDKDILAELDKRRNEIKDEGLAYIKARYKRYLKNIDDLCNDRTDRRTCLAANQFMIEKMDGKNTARLEVADDREDQDEVNVLDELSKLDKDKDPAVLPVTDITDDQDPLPAH